MQIIPANTGTSLGKSKIVCPQSFKHPKTSYLVVTPLPFFLKYLLLKPAEKRHMPPLPNLRWSHTLALPTIAQTFGQSSLTKPQPLRYMFFSMAMLGPKLMSQQLTLGRIVDIGTVFSVVGLAVAHIQGEIDTTKKDNLNDVLVWLHSSLEGVVERLNNLSKNSDALTLILARKLIENVVDLEPFFTDHPAPNTERNLERI